MKSWADFQKEFSSALMRPLDPSRGTLTPEPHPLAVYNRQYWIRFFTTLQQEYPLVARLMGYWTFNCLVQEFLQVYPPRDYDLQAIADPFPKFLLERQAERIFFQAATLDQARTRVFLAADHQPWQLTPDNAAQLATVQLMPAASWQIVREDWALWDLWIRLPTLAATEGALPRPHSWPRTQYRLLHRTNLQMMQHELSAAQAEFYELLIAYPVGTALVLLQEKYPDTDLPPLIQAWMMQSVEWGLWASP